MWKTTIRGLVAHKLRFALTAIAIVLGVSFVAGTYVFTDTITRTFDELFGDIFDDIDLVVRSESAFVAVGPGTTEEREPVPEEIAATVAGVPGVAAAEGSVQGYAQLVDKQGEAITTGGAPTFGTSWDDIGSILQMREGRAPTGAEEIAVDAVTARTHDFAVGDRIKVLLQGPAEEFRIVGILGFGAADNLAGATLAAFEAGTAQRVLGKEGIYDSVAVIVAEGVDAEGVQAQIAALLPAGIEVVTGPEVGEEQSSAITDQLGFFRTALLVFAVVALGVGGFIIYNTFAMVVAQRTREFALLRAVGASRRQITMSVVAESTLVGVIASAIGVGGGILLANGLRALMSAFGMDLPRTDNVLLPRTVVIAMVVGVGATVGSSIGPARRAARVSPIEGLREGIVSTRERTGRRSALGGVALAIGGAFLALGLTSSVGRPILNVGIGVAIVFAGVTLLGPVLARPVAGTLGAPLVRLRGTAGKLARGNSLRNPRRTSSTAAALMIGLALVSFVTVFAASMKRSVESVIDQTVGADYVLSSGTGFASVAFSPEVAKRMSDLDEIAFASPMSWGQARIDGNTRFVIGVDPSTIGEVVDLDLQAGSLEALARGGILVHEDAARSLGVAVGDRLRVEFARTGTQRLPVAGIHGDKRIVEDFALANRTFAENFSELGHISVLAKAAQGVEPAASRRAIETALTDFPNIQIRDQAEFKAEQSAQVDQLLGMVTALLGLAIIIALIGIANTLALSIFERTRELGLLRAVGMSRRQVRSMIRWEAVIIAVLGAVLGLGVGIFFGWAMVAGLRDQGFGELAIPGSQLAVYVVLAGIAGVFAAVFPARRAARLDVLRAIATE